jgi:hypothetical protein
VVLDLGAVLRARRLRRADERAEARVAAEVEERSRAAAGRQLRARQSRRLRLLREWNGEEQREGAEAGARGGESGARKRGAAPAQWGGGARKRPERLRARVPLADGRRFVYGGGGAAGSRRLLAFLAAAAPAPPCGSSTSLS